MQNLQEYNHQLCKIDFQLGNLRKLKPCPEVNHHINTLTKKKQLLESNIEKYTSYIILLLRSSIY